MVRMCPSKQAEPDGESSAPDSAPAKPASPTDPDEAPEPEHDRGAAWRPMSGVPTGRADWDFGPLARLAKAGAGRGGLVGPARLTHPAGDGDAEIAVPRVRALAGLATNLWVHAP